MKKKMIGSLILLFSLLTFNTVSFAEENSNIEYDIVNREGEQYTNEQIMELEAIPSYSFTTDFNMIQGREAMNAEQAKVVNELKSHLGKKYQWAGKGPDVFDCSGLVSYVYKHAVNITLPSYTVDLEKYGDEVSLSSLLPGDLLFYGNKGSSRHVGIYIGDGNMIHASPTHNVVVQEIKYYYPQFAKRILNNNNSGFALIKNGASISIKESAFYFTDGTKLTPVDKERAYIVTGYKEVSEKYGSRRIYSLKNSDKWLYEADVIEQTSIYPYIPKGSSIQLKESAFYYYNGNGEQISKEDKQNGYVVEDVIDIVKAYGSIRAYKVKGANKWLYEGDVIKQTSNYPYISMGKSVKIKDTATKFLDNSFIPDAIKTKNYKLVGVKDIKKKSGSIRAYKLEGLDQYILEQDLQIN